MPLSLIIILCTIVCTVVSFNYFYDILYMDVPFCFYLHKAHCIVPVYKMCYINKLAISILRGVSNVFYRTCTGYARYTVRVSLH